MLGFAFGVVQMALYMCYKKHTPQDLVKTVNKCDTIPSTPCKFKDVKDIAIIINVEPDETSASSYESESGSGDDSNNGA